LHRDGEVIEMDTWVLVLTAVVALVLLVAATWLRRHSPPEAVDEHDARRSRWHKEIADYNYWNSDW
jgi:hypothetical protein